MRLRNSIEKLMHRQNLDESVCQLVLNEMLKPDANPLQTAAFLVLLRSKTETRDELSGLVRALKQKMLPVITPHKVLDIVGTGGDGAQTINISTGSAILAASCGIKVAKHGNHAVSSLAGSADVLEALGIVIDLSPDKISQCIDEVGIGFCYSPNFHPALRELKILRRQLNVPTTLNICGPLLNPTNPAHLLLGVFDESVLELMACALQQMGTVRSIVVHGCGLDEISCVGPATILEITQSDIKKSIIDPAALGLPSCRISDLQGGNAKTNAQILLEIFSGRYAMRHQAIADTLVLNAGVALMLYGIHKTLIEALQHARENLNLGCALILLNRWREFSHE